MTGTFYRNSARYSTSENSAQLHAELAGLRILVIGTGLIGTSVGLALREHGTDVLLADRSQQRLAAAVARGAGRLGWRRENGGPALGCAPDDRSGLPADPPPADIDHVVLAVPPREIGGALVQWQRLLPGATFSDTASVKVQPLVDARRLGADLSATCGAHPVAGRERSGPDAAQADMFIGRPWIITPSEATLDRARDHARLVALGCGASVVELDPESHDLALGLVSHLPHVVASAVAARLALVPEELVRLAGPGLMDFTRIAGANADLWTEIVGANAMPVAALLNEVITELGQVRDALAEAPVGRTEPQPVVERLFRLGNTGRFRLEAGAGPRPEPAASGPSWTGQEKVSDLVPGQAEPRGASVRAIPSVRAGTED